MAVYKEGNAWRVIYRYTDWTGKRKQTSKRGFETKREALAWEREQLQKVKSDLDMTLDNFFKVYETDMKTRIKENTWECTRLTQSTPFRIISITDFWQTKFPTFS